jgi:hypothetical protein
MGLGASTPGCEQSSEVRALLYMPERPERVAEPKVFAGPGGVE